MASRKILFRPFEYWHAERFLFLLISVVVLLVLSPFLNEFRWFKIIRDIMTSWIFLEIFRSTTSGRRRLFFSFLLVLLAIGAVWIENIFGSGNRILLYTSAIIVVYLFYSIVILAGFISGAERVNRKVIYAAVIVYLLLCMVWGYFYITLEFFIPGSFAFPFDMDLTDKRLWLMYFSYVTITTLGYGDITPLNAKACALASTEALIGQIYLVVIVAWLVGMHVSQRSEKNKNRIPAR